MLKYCIIIPCFNEEKRILTNEYIAFVQNNPNFNLFFVDDGSTDNTSQVVNNLTLKSSQIKCLILKKNSGKGEAIRLGINSAIEMLDFDYYGYFDSDLAIPLSELIRLTEKIEQGYEFAFSSKKPSQGSELEIKFKRYFIGRVLSKMVSTSLKLKIYDTQCGCKLISKELTSLIFRDKFMSAWLFDVELIWRIIVTKGRVFFNEKAIEVPVKKIIDRGSSRIKISDLFSLPFEFLRIHSYYTKLQKGGNA